MKRIKLLIILLLISTFAISQNTIWHYGKIGMRYDSGSGNDTLLIQFSGDSTYFLSNTNPIFKFSGGLLADSIKVDSGGWTKLFLGGSGTAGYIPYFSSSTILAASPLLLTGSDISSTGKIEATNMETNITSQTTRLGIQSGANENETQIRKNVFIGYQAGYANTTGINNIFNGYQAGYANTTGSNNVFNGYQAGYNTTGYNNVFNGLRAGYSNTTGSNNVFIGVEAGYSNTTGSNNVFNGYRAGYSNTTGQSSIFIGKNAGYYETNSNRLVIDNQTTGTQVGDEAHAIIYGKMDASVSNQTLTFNADTTFIRGHAVVDSNLYVYGRSILEKYEAAAYVPTDSTLTTSASSTWTFLGAGSNNKFVNTYVSGFAFDGDTIYFDQDPSDYRDSVDFQIDWANASTATNNGITLFYGIFIKHVGESTYTEYQPVTHENKMQTSGDLYSWGSGTFPVYLKNGDKIQIRIKTEATATTVTTQRFTVHLIEK